MSKLRLAVIFGGRACEHDVSIITGLQAIEAVDAAQYDVIPVYIARDGAWYTGDVLRDLAFMRTFRPEAAGVIRVYPDVTAGSGALLALEKKKGLFSGGDSMAVAARIDVALLTLHGMNGEDGAVQGLLELMNVPYTSSGLVGSAVGMDKITMRMVFRAHGFPVLDAVWSSRGDWSQDPDAVLTRAEETLRYPMFVKPANLGSSIGISRATDRQTLREGIEVALSYDRRVLIEQGVENPTEVNCSVIGFDQDVTPSVLEMPARWESFLTFDEKYLRGGKGGKGAGTKGAGMESLARQIPAPIGEKLTQQVQALSADIFRSLDCKGVVRIDFMLDGETVYVGEINTIPGSLSFYLWTPSGLPYPKLIDRLVEYAFRAHAEKNQSVFAYDSTILSQATLGQKGAKR